MTEDLRPRVGPPRPPFGFSVGVTGHRVEAVGRDTIDEARARMERVIAELARAGEAIRAANAPFFDDKPSQRRFISPLADGADQLAAEIALGHGFTLETILPFPAEVYATDFTNPGDAAGFRDLLGRASAQLELPGDRAHSLDAYVSAGRAVVAHADLLVALWDGEPARGRGGTAEIVEHALRRGLPVIHVAVDPAEGLHILWTGYDDPAIDVLDFCDAPSRPFNPKTLEALLTQLLAPPAGAAERGFARLFLGEYERRTRVRIEYPLLLALLGVRRLRSSHVRVEPYTTAVEAEWRAFHRGCTDASHAVSGGFRALEQAYCWSGKLAEHYAGTYRSGHVLNFALAALATMLALAGLIAPEQKQLLVAAELGAIGLFILNTRVGTKRAWHRRWLDYRHLAEQLRPMRSLKLFALARPPATSKRRGGRRWIDWYAAAFWRAMGCPDGKLDCTTLALLSDLTVQEEIKPQLDYHNANAHRMHKVEHRLHSLANILFAVTLTSLVIYLVSTALRIDPALLHRFATPLAVITAGLPALGAALHGIREQGEFARTSIRSASTATALEKLAGDLSVRPITLTRASALAEEAVRVMLDDVGEWRMSYEMRNLALPA